MKFHFAISRLIGIYLLLTIAAKAASTTPTPTPIPTSVTFSTNATSIEVGKPFTARCVVNDFDPATNKNFSVLFYAINNYIGEYKSTGRKAAPFEVLHANKSDHEIIPLSPVFPIYEIAIIPKTASHHLYYCSFYHDTVNFMSQVYSNQITVTAHQRPGSAPPSLTFSANVKKFKSGTFTATCTISESTTAILGDSPYSVSFYSKRDGLLATYEEPNKGQPMPALLMIKEHSNTVIHQGPRTTFPHFDLNITEQIESSGGYWCELVTSRDERRIESNHWPALVQFHSTSVPSNNKNETRNAVCSLVGFNLSGAKYYVRFHTDLGEAADNLLATFTVSEKAIVEFEAAENVNHWSAIKHGKQIAYPNFEIEAKLEQFSGLGNWWCELVIQERLEFKHYESNHVPL